MFYSTRWASLPGWFLSGDLLITEWLLISGKSVRCISLPLLDCSKNSSCQEIWGLQSQIYRCSELQEQLPHRRYLSQWKQTGSCAFKCMQMAKYMWYCAQKGQQTYYLLPMVCMHLPCMQTDLVDHTQTIAKKNIFFQYCGIGHAVSLGNITLEQSDLPWQKYLSVLHGY